MKVIVECSTFSENYAMSVADGQALMGVFGRSATVKPNYTPNKGIEYEYKAPAFNVNFTLVPEDKIKYPADLTTLVQVTREEQAGQAIPDEGVNTEASRTDEVPV